MTVRAREKKCEIVRFDTDRSVSRESRSNGFFSGVFVLSLSTVIVKIIGLVYKIPMLSLLGSEGMGYFNSAYELYTLFCVISTAGLPVAMSVMISSSLSRGDGHATRIFKVSMRLFLVLGLLGSVILVFFARPFAGFLGGNRVLRCIFAIAPTVFFICLASAYRGYFQGFGKMAPTAISQVIEALGKLILGLIFALLALRSGFATETVAAFAVLGLTLGTAASALYLALAKRFDRRKSPMLEGRGEWILPELLRTAIPVTLSSAVISITKVIDMTMILRRMQSLGLDSEEAFAAYGNYTTLALPLFSLAPALIGAVAMPLIPALSRAVAAGDRDGQVDAATDAMKLTSVIAMPVSLGLALFARPILELIFSGQTEAIEAASPLLCILGISVPLSCLITVSNAVLQAYKRAGIPILSMAIGSGLKILLAYFLIGKPEIGIAGAPISTFFCDLTICFVNFYYIGKCMPRMPRLSETFLRPFLAAAVSVTVARVVYNGCVSYFEASAVITLAAVCLAAVCYLITTVLFGVLGKKELSMMPIPKRRVSA